MASSAKRPKLWDESQGLDCKIAETFLNIEEKLNEKLEPLAFALPVTHIYNPLLYARETHADYILKYCRGKKKVLFLGMNPGPFGMAQNGVS